MAGSQDKSGSLVDGLIKLTGQMAGNTLELARSTATMTAMFGETKLRGALLSRLEPERLEAMAEAGRFLRDARETAGLSLKDLAEGLGMSDKSMLEDVESGESILPLELMLRAASLVARHDPVPFLIKFMRTYNPSLEKTLESWGVLALPKQYERERRFINIYRQHDSLRGLTDEEFERFVSYLQTSTDLVLEMMMTEKAARGAARSARAEPEAKPKVKAKAKARRKTAARSKSGGGRKSASTSRNRGN